MIPKHAVRTKAFALSAVQILLLLATVQNSTAGCPDRYVSIGTQCYYFDDQERITWYQAYFKCKFNLKGNLVEIESQEEQNNIRQYIQSVIDPTGQYSFWIGATDLLLQNEYRWMTSGKLLTFKAWYARTYEPNNLGGNENCARMSKADDYFWNDLSCTNTGDFLTPPLRAICETVSNQ